MVVISKSCMVKLMGLSLKHFVLLLLICSALLVSCNSALFFPTISPPAPAHLKYFGHFFVDVEVDDPHDTTNKTNFTDEVASSSNLAQMTAYFASQDLRARIRAMNDLCVKPFLSLQEVFFDRVDKAAPSGTRFALVSDYQTRWETFKTTNAGSLEASSIGAFYLVDEPVWNGVTFGDLETIAKMVKRDFPSVPTLIVEAYSVLDSLRVPTSIDWIGFDRYEVFKPSTDASYLAQLATLKSKRSTPDQKLFLVIDDQWIPEYGQLGVSASQMSATIQDYYDLAASDPEIAGLLGYRWAGNAGDPAIGVRDMPQNIIDLNVSIGKRIKANNSPCSKPTAP
jgi:hypothetical protein